MIGWEMNFKMMKKESNEIKYSYFIIIFIRNCTSSVSKIRRSNRVEYNYCYGFMQPFLLSFKEDELVCSYQM